MQPSHIEPITNIIDESRIKSAFQNNGFSISDLELTVSRLHDITVNLFNTGKQTYGSCQIAIGNFKVAEFSFQQFGVLFNGYKTFHIYTFYFNKIV